MWQDIQSILFKKIPGLIASASILILLISLVIVVVIGITLYHMALIVSVNSIPKF